MSDAIKINNMSLLLPNKVCFEDFSANVQFGDRIAIIGKNGSGKSSLLKMIVENNPDVSFAYIPQIIDDFDFLSGGERFNKKLSGAIGGNPSVLLLDEPTNHLDSDNRKSLMRMLNSYYGTLIVVTHDEELLRNCIDILWHIDNGKIIIFHGKYDDYINELRSQRKKIFHEIQLVEREKKSMHNRLMKEQERISKSKSAGEKKIANKKWLKSIADMKTMKAENAQGKNLRNVDEKKQKLSEQLKDIRLPETIVPKFHLSSSKIYSQTVVSIVDGEVGYSENSTVLRDINLSIMSDEHWAIIGKNGSGKTTLIRAIMNDKSVIKRGNWHCPPPEYIGYLDQHYKNLGPDKTAIEVIKNVNPAWNSAEIRKHLNDFLFRKNEEVSTQVCNLSGGEKVRLSLAQIAAKVPKLLILDEITNNVDLETKNHVVDVLQNYPSAVIVVSHDASFLDKLHIERIYNLGN